MKITGNISKWKTIDGKHRFLLFILIFFHSFILLQAQPVSYSREDSLRVVELLMKGAKTPANEPLTIFYAKQLMNLPYVAHTLEIKDREEHLAINLQSLDCTTLVENCCALALTTSHGSKSWKDYLSWLRKLRYDNGKIDGYKSRNHYFSQWIQSGTKQGLVKEIEPPTNISVPMKLSLTYMSEHTDSYPLLKVNMNERKLIGEMEMRASGATVRYIPKGRVGNSKKVLSCIKDGDIIAITTKKKGLDISHVGFAVWGKDGKLHLLNASSIHKKVVLEPMTLYEYMQKHSSQTGIRVIRLQTN
ncbi:MAG: DUF1460 domain-containing protein [Bacteroidaceae bacterium]|nr:DUF1460 domain-containing protein [Bacteroidaceae bacterium]